MMRFHARYLLILTALLLLAACESTRDTAMSGDTLQAIPIIVTAVSSQSQAERASVSQPQPSSMNAGDIDDNSQWGAYLQYRSNFLQTGYRVHDLNVSNKQSFTVMNAQKFPIIGARVLVYDGQNLIAESRTDASGSTNFFPNAWQDGENSQQYRVVVQKDKVAVQFTLDPQAHSDWDITLDSAQQSNPIPLDILFLLDTTGSMGDEIAQLQNNILNISAQVNQLQNNADVRYGLVTYRDRGDEYVTQTYDFVSDVHNFQTQLKIVRADGGGDTPESLNEGVHVAVQGVNWRGDDTVKLIFLVADAPPHLDYANDYDYAQEMVAAAWHGIKVYPIASSGLPKDGEYIFRQIAQYTLGHFIFLTYQQGTSGAAGTERTDLDAGKQGNYTVDQLDELVEKFIAEEVSALSAPLTPQGTVPQLKSVAPQPANAMPQAFALAESQQPAPYMPPPRPAPSGIPRPSVPQINISISLTDLLLVVVVTLVGGYWLLASRTVEKRKRKNEEILLEAED